MKRTPLKRYTRIKPRRAAPRTHKLVVRLEGEALARLRYAVFIRDRGRCQVCGRELFYQARFDGDPLAYDMAHRQNKRMYGDTPSNVRALCHEDHMAEHAGHNRRDEEGKHA